MSRALVDTEVRLHHLIAEAYLRLGKSRLARIYVERIYGPLAGWDDRVNKVKFPLEIPPDGATPRVYAELLLVAARISRAHGAHYEALAELDEALRLDPLNKEVLEFQETCHVEVHIREHRLRLARDRERKAAERKFNGSSFRFPARH